MNWDYLAGFVDGEGSLSLNRGAAKRTGDRPRALCFRPCLGITNNNRQVLELIQCFLRDGAIYRCERSSVNARVGWRFVIMGNRLLPVLRELEPRLHIKQRQAELLIAFIERRKQLRTRRLTETDYEFVRQCRALNNRAPGHGAPHVPLPARLQATLW